MTDPLLGRRLGRYEIRDRLGHGGMARVYRAVDHNLRREVALKVLNDAALLEPDFAARFQREAQTLAALRHPQIVQVYDYGEHDGVTYIAVQLLAGPTLDQELADLRAQGRLMERAQVITAITQLAEALDYAHAHGVIHRDLKPSNALRNDRGDLVLTDFGIAKAMGSASGHTQAGQVLGTPAYLAPEQGRGATLSPASDVYALGVMLFEVLTGRVPFDDANPMAVLLAHLQQPPPPLRSLRPELPAALEQVVLTALAKEPTARYQSAGALARALAAAWPAVPVAAQAIHNQPTRFNPAPVPPPAPPSVPVQPVAPPATSSGARTPTTATSAAPSQPQPPDVKPLPFGLLLLAALVLLGYGAFTLLRGAGASSVEPPGALPTLIATAEPPAPTASIEAPPAPTDEAVVVPIELPTPTDEAVVVPIELPTPTDEAVVVPIELPTPTDEPPPTQPPPTQPPPTQPPPTQPPPPTEPPPTEPPAAPSARQQVEALLATVRSGSERGEIKKNTAAQLAKTLGELDERLAADDLKDARKKLAELRREIDKGAGDDTISASVAAELRDGAEALELALKSG